MRLCKVFLGLLFSIISLSVSGQRQVSGRVTDAGNGEPIQGASVFIVNSTLGISTDADGYYKLSIPGSGSYKLAASHTGYKSDFKNIDPGNKSITIDFVMNNLELEEVTVEAKIKSRKQDIDLFWETVLGRKPHKNYIFAANPGAAYYYYNSEANRLTVTCPEPLQVFNIETGYHIELILERFTHNYNTKTSSWEAKYKFTELTPANIKQEIAWEKNREKIYRVSLNNFIKSLYNNSLRSNGFVMFNFDESPKEVILDDKIIKI